MFLGVEHHQCTEMNTSIRQNGVELVDVVVLKLRLRCVVDQEKMPGKIQRSGKEAAPRSPSRQCSSM